MQQKVYIFNYHRVYPGGHMTPDAFENHLALIKKKFENISLDDAVGFAKGERRIKKNSFVITFDDGWADNFVYAYPILKKYGLRAVLFVSTDFISTEKKIRPNLSDVWVRDKTMADLQKFRDQDEAIKEFALFGKSDEFLTWSEINAMKDVFSIESHGKSHAYVFKSTKKIGSFKDSINDRPNWLMLYGNAVKPGAMNYESGSGLVYPALNSAGRLESDNEFEIRTFQELSESIKIIKKYTAFDSKYLAWPFGEYNSRSIKIAQAAGFVALLTTEQGYILHKSNVFKMKRLSPPRKIFYLKLSLRGKIGVIIYNFLSLARRSVRI